jgi:hypothetical protein
VASDVRRECPFRVSRYEPASRGPCGLWQPLGSWPGPQARQHRLGRSRRFGGLSSRQFVWPLLLGAECMVGLTNTSLTTFASPSETACGSRGPSLASGAEAPKVRSGLLSWGSFKDRPSTGTSLARPLPAEPRFDLRPGAATLQTRSALVVPPDSDGLLRARPRRSVAPCNRPWGSPRFQFAAALPRRRPFPGGADPSKLFPPWQPSRVAAVRALSPLFAGSSGPSVSVLPRPLPTPLPPVARPQGVAPPRSPLQTFRCFHRALLDAPLGFSSPE